MLTALLAGLLVMAEGAWVGAHPPTPIGKNGRELRGKTHRWLHQSRMPLVGGRLRVIYGACPANSRFAACVITSRPSRIYLRPSAKNLKGTLYHELGHTFDLRLLRHRDRRAFKRIMRLRTSWFKGSSPPSELFGESYALCARFGLRRPPRKQLDYTQSIYGYRPSRSQHRAVCKLIARAGAPKRQRRRPKPQPPPNAPPVYEQQSPQPPPKSPDEGPPPLVPGLPGVPILPKPV